MTTLDDELQDAIDRGELEPNKLGGTLATLVDIVRQSRERTAGVFPLPTVDDCIDFAITEAAEYIDALKRENAAYKRNNDKEHSTRKEWSQTGYMICSAIIQIDTHHLDAADWEPYIDAAQGNVYVVISRLCDIRNGLAWMNHENPHVDVLDEWHAFAVKCGWNPADLLRETCAEFEAKHLSVVRGYDFEPAGQLFRYPVLSAEDAQAQGEQAE